MERAADATFVLAMLYMSDAAMQRRSAKHFTGVDRLELEAKADGFRETAYGLAMAGVDAPAADR
jgi:hypothetical protein